MFQVAAKVHAIDKPQRGTIGRPAPAESDRAGTTMQSVERTCNVLLSFKAEEPVLGVSGIARRLGLPKSAVHRTLDSLVRMGLVARDRTSSRYRLGPRAADLGFAALGTPDIRGLALPLLQDLSRRTRETATLSLLSGHERFYAAQVEGPEDVKMVIEIGKRCPLYAGASGRAILAYFSTAQLSAYLAATRLEPLTENTITSPEDLVANLGVVRSRGYSVSLGERDPWAGAVAAPVFLGDVLIGSISICGPHIRFTPDKVTAYGELVKAETEQLSKQLA
jgi:DNA-binding IclR family transcriptional regulator